MPFRSSRAQRSARTEHIAVMVAATSRNRRRETRESGSSDALKDMTGSYTEFAGQVCAVTKDNCRAPPVLSPVLKVCRLELRCLFDIDAQPFTLMSKSR